MVKTIFDGAATGEITTDSFVISRKNSVGIHVDNNSDVATINFVMEGKVNNADSFVPMRGEDGAVLSYAVDSGESAFIILPSVPLFAHMRVYIDATAATTGTLTVKALV